MRITRALFALSLVPGLLAAQGRRPARAAAVPKPADAVAVTAARYRVVVDPRTDVFTVRAEFTLPQGRDTVLLSLPAWSPGDYAINNYARWVHGVHAEADGHPAFWDKLDKDTWRIATGGARSVALEFETNPDSMMLQFSGITSDFAWLNGTNVLVYPEGTDYQFAADVEIVVPDGWRVATGLDHQGGRMYRAANYHDLVDCPIFAGRLGIDSTTVDGRTVRLALYPDSAMTPAVRDTMLSTIRRLMTAQNRIFGGPPYQHYTFLFAAPATELQWGGGLEHNNSQFDVIPLAGFADLRTGRLGPFTPSLLSHESFHLFNVKRIRPAEMWPYDYAREQHTPLLWWSEGVTDYYGDVTATRAGVWSMAQFIQSVQGNVAQVEDAAETVAVEDASTNTWIEPTYVNESQYYYPKGSLLGLMLDIQIRSATNNQHSLDDVMRSLYDNHYRRGRGFTTADLLGYIRPWYPDVDAFYARYVNGRDTLPYSEILPKGGIAVEVREARIPRVGVGMNNAGPRDGGIEVTSVTPNSLAMEAGLQAGDILLSVGGIATGGPDEWGVRYRARYANAEGQQVELVWRRGGVEMRGSGRVRILTTRGYGITRDPNPTPQARMILDAILGQER
jgi:predicted metalloprotease with PDZ domain